MLSSLTPGRAVSAVAAGSPASVQVHAWRLKKLPSLKSCRAAAMKISSERGFHNRDRARVDAIASKPVEFKVKLEVYLRIANRLAHLLRV